MKYWDANQVEAGPAICGAIKELYRGEHYSTALVTITQGKCTGKHYHKKMDETYHVLSGKGIFVCDGQEYELKPGIEVNICPGEWHQTHAKSKLELLVITSPAFTAEDVLTE